MMNRKTIVLVATSASLLGMPAFAQDAKKIATVVKIAGIQWFNRM